MIGDKCDGINKVIPKLIERFPKLIDLHGHNVCFDISSKLNSGSIATIAASVIFMILGLTTLRVLRK